MKTIRIKNQTYNVGTLLTLMLFGVACLIIITDSALNLRMWSTWDSGGVLEYQGNYQFSKKRNAHNTSYVFLLDNGDSIQIPSEHIINKDYEFDNSEPLKFRYLAHKSIFHIRSHTGVAITTIDNSNNHLNEELLKSETIIKSEVIISAIFFLLLGILGTSISILPYLFDIYLSDSKTRRNIRRKKRKRKIKR